MSEERKYQVTWEGRVREVYFVMAASEEEAHEKWSDYEPDISESMNGEVTEIEVCDD